MTAHQPPPVDASAGERRARGLALANALLENGQELTPLTGVAHARVKRRLLARNLQRPLRRTLWLRPVVIVSIGLVCGAAFGVALDRVVLKSGGGLATQTLESGSGLVRTRARSGKTSPKLPIASADETTAHSEEADTKLLPSQKEARPANDEGHAAMPEASGPTHASSHSRKLALRAEPLNTVPEQAPTSWEDVAPLAPSGFPLESPSPTAPVAPSPPLDIQPAIAPTPAPAAASIVNPLKRPASDGLSEERLLAAAVRALRAQTDPQSALAALDEYSSQYPHGRLFVEAAVLRVDALAAMKNTSGVLRVLDGLDFALMPGGLARQLQRGELRAAAGRYREAEADFTDVLARGRSQDFDALERALWGRAQSRAGRGDATGTRLDANEYLRRFPRGRFAAAAARMGSPVAP